MLISALAEATSFSKVRPDGETLRAQRWLGLGANFQRVQFTPNDSERLIGTMEMPGKLVLERGPSHQLLPRRLDQPPPRACSRLLEAMQERHVTLRGRHYASTPVLRHGTQNPYEHEGFFP